MSIATLTATGGTGSYTWTKTGGADAAKFTLTSAGVLSFVTPPDFEAPTDANADNVYVVTVQVADGISTPVTQTISVTVTNVVEGPATTWNPSDTNNPAYIAYSNGNLTVTASNGVVGTRATRGGAGGKVYWEQTINANGGGAYDSVGVGLGSANLSFSGNSAGMALVVNSGTIIVNNAIPTGSPALSALGTNTVGIAMDFGAKLIWFRYAPSGNWNGSGAANPATGVGGVDISSIVTGPPLFPLATLYGTGGDSQTANFGASSFVGAVPSGFASGFLPDATVTTWNPSDKSPDMTLSGGNLTQVNSTGSNAGVRSTINQTTGKVYFEVNWTSMTGGNTGCGIGTNLATLDTAGLTTNNVALLYASGVIWINGGAPGSLPSFSSGTICVAVDLINKRIWFRLNGGNWNNSGTANPATNTGGLDITSLFASTNQAFAFISSNSATGSSVANFGATAFSQAVPSGFSSWNAN